MYEKFKERKPYELLNTSKYPPEVAGRFNSFITTQFDDSLSVEMQMRSIIKWAIDNFKEMDETYNDFTEYIISGNINVFIEFLNDLIAYMNNFIDEFDGKLTQNIINKLTGWLDDGTLADIINNDVFDMKADKSFVDSEIDRLDQKDENISTQLAQTPSNMINVTYQGILDNGTDQTTALVNLFTSLPVDTRGTYYIPYGVKFDVETVYDTFPVGINVMDNSLINDHNTAGYKQKMFKIASKDTDIDDTGLMVVSKHHPNIAINNMGGAVDKNGVPTHSGDVRVASLLFAGGYKNGLLHAGLRMSVANDGDKWKTNFRVPRLFKTPEKIADKTMLEC